MIIPPQQTRELDIDLPPEVAALVAAGGVFTYAEGPIIPDGDGCFHRELLFYVDQRFQGSVHVSWRVIQEERPRERPN